ncbi:hypothetical protein [Chryseobacterium sp.]|uniref:hypothetical protein n=1 Tax=Chryseobacterium sp. TaxID=1871047 RepID=UPI00388ED2A1
MKNIIALVLITLFTQCQSQKIMIPIVDNKFEKFGYGTFWPSNNMHNAISFPSEPKKPKEPIRTDYKDDENFKRDQKEYKNVLSKYEEEMINYNISLKLKPNSTFHHLFVVYKEGLKEPDYDRVKKYFEADIPQKELQEFYKIELENEKKINKD